MFISLQTIDVWMLENASLSAAFFLNIDMLLAEEDVLVIGSYKLSESVVGAVTWMDCQQPIDRLYFETFDLNRDDYPEGRAWHLSPSRQNLEKLANLATICKDGEMGVDHLLAYRPKSPLLPLFNYHDTFMGEMFVSGLYGENEIANFCVKIGSQYRCLRNPEIGG